MMKRTLLLPLCLCLTLALSAHELGTASISRDTTFNTQDYLRRSKALASQKQHVQGAQLVDTLLCLIEDAQRGVPCQDYVNALTHKAYHLAAMERYQEADACYLQALDMEREVKGEGTLDYVSLLCIYGGFLGDYRGDVDGAVQVLEDAYYLLDECDDNILPMQNKITGKLSKLYAEQDKNKQVLWEKRKEAKKLTKQAKKQYGKQSDQYAEALWGEAGAHMDYGELDDAIEAMEQARKLKGTLYGTQSLEYGKLCYELALIYDMNEQADKAKAIGINALPIMEKHLLVSDREYLPNMMLIAED